MDRRQLIKGGLAATAGSLLGPRVRTGRVDPEPVVGVLDASLRPGAFFGRSGNRLLGPSGATHRFVGANLYWLGLDDNLGSAPQYPSEQAIRQGLSAAAALGCGVVRSHTLGISVGDPLSVAPAHGEYNDGAFGSIDYAVAAAREMGLRLMIPLTDAWRYYHGGKWVFVQWAYANGVGGVAEPSADLAATCSSDANERATEAAFYTNATVISYFEDYITHILTHENPYTGLALGADPTILAWETGNELWDATPQWTAEIAGHLKALAPRTLVADGSAASGLAVADAPGLGVAAVDIVGAHYYPPDAGQLGADAAAAAAASKVMVVGEWPSTTPGMATADWTTAIETTPGISGDALWTVLPWGADGTPEPHGDGYCLHVPGADPAEIGIAEAVFTHAAAVRAANTPRTHLQSA